MITIVLNENFMYIMIKKVPKIRFIKNKFK